MRSLAVSLGSEALEAVTAWTVTAQSVVLPASSQVSVQGKGYKKYFPLFTSSSLDIKYLQQRILNLYHRLELIGNPIDKRNAQVEINLTAL